MPEFPVDEDDGPVFFQGNVRFSNELFEIDPIAISGMPQCLSEGEFRLGVPAPDFTHDLGAFRAAVKTVLLSKSWNLDPFLGMILGHTQRQRDWAKIKICGPYLHMEQI